MKTLPPPPELNVEHYFGAWDFFVAGFPPRGNPHNNIEIRGCGGNHLSLRNATGQSFFPSTVFYWVASIATHMPGATLTSFTFPCLMTSPHKFATTVASINERTKEQTHVHLHAPLSRASCIIHDVCNFFEKTSNEFLKSGPHKAGARLAPVGGVVWVCLGPSGVG